MGIWAETAAQRPQDARRRDGPCGPAQSFGDAANARKRLPQGGAEGELIGTRGSGPAARLLRRHVPGRSLDVCRGFTIEARQAEVQQADDAIFVYHHVFGFEVAMNDVRRVRRRQPEPRRNEHLHDFLSGASGP